MTRGRHIDLLPAIALTAAGGLELLLGTWDEGSRLVSGAAMAAAALPLAWRRQVPLLPLAAVAVVLVVQGLLGGLLVGHMVTPLAVIVLAVYSAGRHVEGARQLAGAVAAIALLVATRIAFDDSARDPGDILLTVAAMALPFLAGRWANGQARLQRKVEERAARLERDRERAARQAAEEERMRIAADLQGAIAGGLREIAADAADVPGRLAASEHAEVRERLAGIASTAREALADVRRVLGVLRREPEAPWAAPAVADPSPEPPRGRRSPISPAWSDRMLVAVLLVAAEVELALRTDSLLAALTPVAIVAPLLLRRRQPVAGALAVLAAIALQSTLLGLEPFPVADGAALVCAVYAIGAYAERRRATAGLALVATGDTVHAAVFNPEAVAIALLGGAAVPWTLGRIVRAQRGLTAEVRQEAAEVERRRALEEHAAVTGERMRVARELHDAVAHNISVIAIQAAGASGIVDRDPRRAIRCAELIEAVAREAIVELGRLAGPESTSGAPGLAGVDSLARRARDGGLPVELHVEGAPVKIPAGVDLAAFRIVQEALANASKHAGGARARVVVRYRPRAVELEIADDGRGANGGGSRNGSGHGLIGMRERAALYGGTLDARSRPGGGFEVRARLPLGAA